MIFSKCLASDYYHMEEKQTKTILIEKREKHIKMKELKKKIYKSDNHFITFSRNCRV